MDVLRRVRLFIGLFAKVENYIPALKFDVIRLNCIGSIAFLMLRI